MLKDLRFVRIATISGMTEGSMVLHANQFCATAARETLGEFDMGDSSSVVDAYLHPGPGAGSGGSGKSHRRMAAAGIERLTEATCFR